MNQIWNIFRKDTRHLRIEIAASLAFLVAFVWFDIRSWNGINFATGAAAALSFFLTAEALPSLVNALLPISWIFLIVRVIQSESLVGDRQFWVTRPYDWKQLLTAKALFVLAFINLPLFCTDAFLLARAGFHPAHYVAGLLWMQLLWIVLLFLLIATLASVTRNIPQMLLLVLFVVLYMIGSSALSSMVRKSDLSGGVDWWEGLLLIVVAITIILMQYSRRKTALSRWLMVGVCAFLTVTAVVTQLIPSDRSRIAREYPSSSGTPPVELGLIRSESEGNYTPVFDHEVSFVLPLNVSGVPKDSILTLDGIIVTLANANGLHWDSEWQGNAQSFFPDQKTAHVAFRIKQDIFDQLKSGPVNARLLLAFTLYRETNQQTFVVPAGEFQMPEMGRCTTETQYSRGIRCLTPMRRPGHLLVTSETASSTCPLGNAETPAQHGVFARATVRGGPGPAEMGISPVHQVDISLSEWDWSTQRPTNPGVCPGTPLILSNPEVAGRRSLELQLDNLSLEDYRERLQTAR